MKPSKEEIKKYLEKEGLKEEDLSTCDLVNLYDHGTIDSLSGIVIIPKELHDKLESQARNIFLSERLFLKYFHYNLNKNVSICLFFFRFSIKNIN